MYADQAVVTITNSQINSSAGNGVYVSSSARLEAHSTDFNLNVQNAIRLMRENYERGLYEGEEYQYWQKVSAMKEKLDLLSRVPESAIERAARALLDLRESWEWVTKELARLMIQEIGVDMAARRVLWIKACPDFDMLFQVLENLRVDDKRRFWIEYQGADEDVCSIREDKGQMGLKVKTFASVVFHNVLTESRSTYNERNVLKK